MTVPAVDTARRFAFGRNWSRYLRHVTDARIAAAMASLTNVFGTDGLRDRRFLDIGCGSGLFSLAAVRLGAEVVSFDFDAESVACAEELRSREGTDPSHWRIEQASVLDQAYLAGLGEFDIVYSWGVLHHTGAMWDAIDHAAMRVAPDGQLWIAIYNDQGTWSRVWLGIKRTYLRLPKWLQPAYVATIGGVWATQRVIGKVTARVLATVFHFLGGRSTLLPQPPGLVFAGSQRSRGMTLWYDLVDWIGGYPFEVAKPEAIVTRLIAKGFQLERMTTCGGDLGCNEFVFRRSSIC